MLRLWLLFGGLLMVSFNVKDLYDATIGPVAHDYVTTPLAEVVYDTLDPWYGEGEILEPITVVVDPERDIKEEYIEPIIEEGKDLYEEKIDPLIDTAKDTGIIVAALAALFLLRK